MRRVQYRKLYGGQQLYDPNNPYGSVNPNQVPQTFMGTGLGGKSILSSADQQAQEAAFKQSQQLRKSQDFQNWTANNVAQTQAAGQGAALNDQNTNNQVWNAANSLAGVSGAFTKDAWGKGVGTGADAAGAAAGAAKGLSPKATSGIAAAGATAGGIVDAFNKPDQFGHKNVGASVGSGALQGASLGLTVGGPWGAAIGGVVGGAYGGISSAIGNKKADRRENTFNTARDRDIRARSTVRYLDEATQGVPSRTWYAQGGSLGIPQTRRFDWRRAGGLPLEVPRNPRVIDYMQQFVHGGQLSRSRRY